MSFEGCKKSPVSSYKKLFCGIKSKINLGAYIGLCSNSSNFKIPEAEHGNHKIAECLVQMRSLPQISATVSLFLVSLFIVVTMNLTAGELFSQQSGSKSVLLTPDTNDLDGLSGLRAITPVPAIDSNSDPFLASPPDREYREREREREYKEREYRNREYRDYNGGQLEQDDFGRQDRTGDRVNGRRYPVRNYPYNQDDNQQYNNQYNQSDSRNNYQGTGDYVARDRSMQPRKYSPDNQSPAAQPDNSNLGAMQPRNQLSDRSADGSRVVRTANAYPAVGNDSRELMNSGARGGVLRNGTSAGEFSSNRVVPFGGAGGADNLAAGQVEGKQEWYATYENDLPFMRVCGMVVVQANFPLEKVALQLHEIEILQRDLSNYLGLPAPREKIELCLFSDEASYMKFLVTRFSNAPRDRRALYIKKNNAPGVVLVQRLKDFEVDLRHEMTHAIVHASIPVVPIWLDEGLAKYFEPLPQDRFNDNPYLKQVRRNMKFGTFAVPTLSRLEKLAVASDMGDSEYRDSWAWVHFMFHHSEKTHKMLAGYLKLLASLPQDKYKDKNGTVKVPNLSLYLEDYVENPRQQFRKHFQK